MTPEQNAAIDAATGKAMAIAGKASNAMWFGSGGALLGGFSVQEVGVLAGIIIGTGGFIVNWVYKHKAHKARVAWYEKHSPEYLNNINIK